MLGGGDGLNFSSGRKDERLLMRCLKKKKLVALKYTQDTQVMRISQFTRGIRVTQIRDS